jgi:hypothetical protein
LNTLENEFDCWELVPDPRDDLENIEEKKCSS